jgi:hypothetical protein
VSSTVRPYFDLLFEQAEALPQDFVTACGGKRGRRLSESSGSITSANLHTKLNPEKRKKSLTRKKSSDFFLQQKKASSKMREGIRWIRVDIERKAGQKGGISLDSVAILNG